MIAGPVRVTAVAVSRRAVPGLVAVSVAALISIAAWCGRALFADMGTGLFLAGVIVPLVPVVGVAVAQRLRPGGGDDAIWEIDVRNASGRVRRVSLRTDAERGSLLTGDSVRVIPARRASLIREASDTRRPLRAVEVLGASGGSVVHRIDATSALSPVQRAGLVLAVLLLAATVVSFVTA